MRGQDLLSSLQRILAFFLIIATIFGGLAVFMILHFTRNL